MIQDQFMILMIIIMKKWCNIKLIAGEIKSKAWPGPLTNYCAMFLCQCLSTVIIQYKLNVCSVSNVCYCTPYNLIGQTFTICIILNISTLALYLAFMQEWTQEYCLILQTLIIKTWNNNQSILQCTYLVLHFSFLSFLNFHLAP